VLGGVEVLPIVLMASLPALVGWIALKANVNYFKALSAVCIAAFAAMLGGMAVLSATGKPVAELIMEGFVSVCRAMGDNEQTKLLLAMLLAVSQSTFVDMEGLMQLAGLPFESLLGQVSDIYTRALGLALPSYVVIISGGCGLAAWCLPTLLLPEARRLTPAQAQRPDFCHWNAPRWVKLPMLLGWAAMVALSFINEENDRLYAAMLAMQEVVMLLFMVQGMATVDMFMRRRRAARALRVIILLLAALLLRQVTAYIGMFDMLMGLRRFWNQKDSFTQQVKDMLSRKDDTDKEE